MLIFDTIPTNSGETLRAIADRGVNIAVTAGAAAAADSTTCTAGRAGASSPSASFKAPAGWTTLMVQQTVSAIAGATRNCAVADRNVDLRDLRPCTSTSVSHTARKSPRTATCCTIESLIRPLGVRRDTHNMSFAALIDLRGLFAEPHPHHAARWWDSLSHNLTGNNDLGDILARYVIHHVQEDFLQSRSPRAPCPASTQIRDLLERVSGELQLDAIDPKAAGTASRAFLGSVRTSTSASRSVG